MMSSLGLSIILLLIWNTNVAESSNSREVMLNAAVDLLNHLVKNKHSSSRVCPDSWVRFQESCYLFPRGTFGFITAEHLCSQHRSQLVHIESQPENNFVKNQMRILKDADYWTGLTASKDWKKWIWHGSKTEALFTDWSSISPNNFGGNQKCVYMQQKYDFQWNDFTCDEKFNAVCEKNQTTNA